MPNIITHTIFCEAVLNNITNEKYKKIIEEHLEEFKIGASGPDFLFFHGSFPIWKKNKSPIPKIGTMFHRENINLFYDTAIQTYLKQQKSDIKDAMASYLIGHYLHWQLDSIMHPYVVYKTGFKEVLSASYHHRFESMMDTILLAHYYHKSIHNFKTYEICKRSELSLDAISSIYLPCILKCQKKVIDKNTIKEALNDWAQAQRTLYDPKSVKYGILKIYEKYIRSPWLFSGNIVRPNIDLTFDVVNENHTLWKHPCTGKVSNESVYDLMNRAIKDASIGLPYLWEGMEGKGNKKILDFIADKTYANGISGIADRIYKDVIYEK